MSSKLLKLAALGSASAVYITGFMTPVFAQSDEIVVTGTRRDARSAADTAAPVDVISGDDFVNQGDVDVANLLRTLVPSYNVNTQPISDAATLVRPANLRGLSPDNTLVLLNGKRRHRAAVISFLGGGISDGAQGPDISVFPALALKQVDVLRDGASSQYGSDAIAGVINFVLRDSAEGGAFEVKYGSTYAGDGDQYQIAGNVGLPIGESGFLNLTAEYSEVDATSRSVQRDDAAALIAAGNTDVANPAQIWGQPNVDGDLKFFANFGYELNDTTEIYAFGNYAERETEGGFFFRNPTNRGGVFDGPIVDPDTGQIDMADLDMDNVDSVLVGDLSVDTAGDCPAGIPLTQGGGLIPDPTFLAQVQADPNCFSFVELFPGGFTPRFGGELEDKSLVVGLRGELAIGNGLGYDISYTYGNNQADFFINNTINASLGPDTPTSFRPGAYEQTDNNFNVDISYPIPIEGFASDLVFFAGYEMREEEFTITAGDPASFAIGPLAAPSLGFPTGQGFSSSSNGFGGFTPASAGSNTEKNDAVYAEVEADVTEQFTFQAAIRYEDYDSFGDTTNYKVGALYKVNDNLRLRGTVSTGFHAPTAGQANVSNVTTAFNGALLVDQGTIPLSSPAGQFISDFIVANPNFFPGRTERPTLGPEEADNFTLGAAFNIGRADVTIDYFNIEVSDRISISEQLDFLGALQQTAIDNGVATDPTTNGQLILLDAAGVLNIADFAGAEDLTSFGFFNNDFDTETEGIDIVVNAPIDLTPEGTTTFTGVFNYTDTSVANAGSLGATRQRQLEDGLPEYRANFTVNHSQGDWRALARMNYYGEFFEAHLDSGDLPIEADSQITFDAEIGWEVKEGLELILGARNLFDSFPDDNPFAGVAGAQYPVTAPGGFNGGSYYLKAAYKW